MDLPLTLTEFLIKLFHSKERVTTLLERLKSFQPQWVRLPKSLLNDGVKLGVSSRGVGTLSPTREGYSMVNDDFSLATAADIVADPSAPDAFVNGIMEGKEWVWDGGILRERLAEKTYKQINTMVDQKRLEENKLNLFQNFLSNL
jgi:hypothetical protein